MPLAFVKVTHLPPLKQSVTFNSCTNYFYFEANAIVLFVSHLVINPVFSLRKKKRDLLLEEVTGEDVCVCLCLMGRGSLHLLGELRITVQTPTREEVSIAAACF